MAAGSWSSRSRARRCSPFTSTYRRTRRFLLGPVPPWRASSDRPSVCWATMPASAVVRPSEADLAEQFLGIYPVLLEQVRVLFVVDLVGQLLFGRGRLVVIASVPEQLDDLVLRNLHVSRSPFSF